MFTGIEYIKFSRKEGTLKIILEPWFGSVITAVGKLAYSITLVRNIVLLIQLL